jgi:hypothetical protein
MEAPVARVIEVAPRTMPSICAPAPSVTEPDTAQTIFLGRAPPRRTTFLLVAKVRVPATWRIHAVNGAISDGYDARKE